MASRRPALLAALAFAAAPAIAQSDLGPADIARAYCAALVVGDTAALSPLLTPELAELTATGDVRWHSGDRAPLGCMPVGASGTREHPESVLFLSFSGGATASDRLVLSFVGDNLRINDIAHADGATLRDSLGP